MVQDHLQPTATALIRGGAAYPDIAGTVSFTPTPAGVLVIADISGLPRGSEPWDSGIFALHIHEGSACSGETFADTGGHWNPGDVPHPHHAGDLPPLFSNHGRAFLAVLTDRFLVPDVVGRTVVIHSRPDDFKSQPAGDSGEKIACGVIRPTA